MVIIRGDSHIWLLNLDGGEVKAKRLQFVIRKAQFDHQD